MITVTFCGHSTVYQQKEVATWLAHVVNQLATEGATTFLLGGYGQFDSLAAKAVQAQKSTHPHIESILVLAYLNRDVDTFGYDGTTFPPLESVPPRLAIVQRNRWMVVNSDVVVSYVNYSWGGAAKTLEYAEQKHKRIIGYPNYDETVNGGI